MAGPCSVESRAQVLEVAEKVKAAGATVLRGGAFKPRTSPYSFQGLEEEGLKLLDEARRETGLPVITEVMEPDKVEVVAEHSDILQIGARNVQNFSLLRRVAETRRPVLLKRGMSTSIQEWLLSAEYVLTGGNPNVILCERGIRTFETATRFTLDLNAVPVLKKLTHLPVVVDPSHGTGHWEYVEPMAHGGGGGRRGRADHRGAPAGPRRRSRTGPSRSSPTASPPSWLEGEADRPGGRPGSVSERRRAGRAPRPPRARRPEVVAHARL